MASVVDNSEYFFNRVTPFSSTVSEISGPFSTDSRIIRPCCLFNIYSSILLFYESYISFSNIGGRLSAPDRIALSARLTSPLVDDDLDEEEAIKVTEKKNLENDIVDETLEIDKIVNIKESRNHPLENVIENLNQRTLRSQAQNQSNFFCFISTVEHKNVNEALGDKSWIVAMQEELNHFVADDVWELVAQPRNMTIIGTKWVFRNKLDENGIVSRNKARHYALRIMVSKGTGIETVVYADSNHAGDYVD
nr:retrovirus-related Pol polyprotein from transposon TNT 1-94 [Tanacetum cinerariifolium]